MQTEITKRSQIDQENAGVRKSKWRFGTDGRGRPQVIHRQAEMIQLRHAANLLSLHVAHRARDVAFGVFEPNECSHADDLKRLMYDFAAMLDDRLLDRSEVIDGEGALPSDAAASSARLLAARRDEVRALGYRALRFVGIGGDDVEIRRSPCLDAPAEDALVEAARALDVIGRDGEMGEMVGHRSKPPGTDIAPEVSTDLRDCAIKYRKCDKPKNPSSCAAW